MRIGFISTWFERGAAYVTKQYADLLKECGHDIFVYARGEHHAKGNEKWDLPYVTWGKKLYDTNIDFRHFRNWIEHNQIDILFFNEQREMTVILQTKKRFPKLKIGTYIDYYTQDSVESFKWYDFLICNTKRHYSVFDWHKQCFYLPWGTDINFFSRKNKVQRDENQIVFFHSAGMSNRKGTDILINTFIDEKMYFKAKLIIHTQLPIAKLTKYTLSELEKNNIEIIERTVTAPGLYYLGDVYVYPTTLDGLGLTMYEALSMGMPVITTDCAPMNEVVDNEIGKLVDVERYTCRNDAYYWPLAYVQKDSLAKAMRYYIDNAEKIDIYAKNARCYAERKYDWSKRKEELHSIFVNAKNIERTNEEIASFEKIIKKDRLKRFGKATIVLLPNWLQRIIVRE